MKRLIVTAGFVALLYDNTPATAQSYSYGYEAGSCIIPTMMCMIGASNRQAIDKLEQERQASAAVIAAGAAAASAARRAREAEAERQRKEQEERERKEPAR